MNEHEIMVRCLVKDGNIILDEMSGQQMHILHMAVGISGEAGELIDAVKKNVIYQITLDRKNVIEELGDLEFYMQGLRDALHITREECLQGNMEKLAKRYENFKYSDAAAKARADKE